jgi:hypothetical protein
MDRWMEQLKGNDKETPHLHHLDGVHQLMVRRQDE